MKLSESNPQTPKKIQVRHVGDPNFTFVVVVVDYHYLDYYDKNNMDKIDMDLVVVDIIVVVVVVAGIVVVVD